MIPAADLALYTGIAVGSAMLLCVMYVFIKGNPFGLGSSLLVVFGVVLLGMSIFKTVQVKLGSEGGLEASFQAVSDQVISRLHVVDLDKWEMRIPNKDFPAEETGFVVALVKADTTHRLVGATGEIDKETVIATAAQDGTVPGVPSIGANSFVMPVPKGRTWRVTVDERVVQNVQIRWFSRVSKLESSVAKK